MSYRVILAAASVLLAASPAAAEPVADFYQGKQIRFVIRAAPGGNYDLYMRLLARYMVRYLPGAPEANSPEIGGVECERSVSANEQLDMGAVSVPLPLAANSRFPATETLTARERFDHCA